MRSGWRNLVAADPVPSGDAMPEEVPRELAAHGVNTDRDPRHRKFDRTERARVLPRREVPLRRQLGRQQEGRHELRHR